MAEKIEVAQAYVTIIPSMQGSQAEITKELTGVTDNAAKEAGSSAGSTFGSNLAQGIKAASAVIAAAVTAATAAAVAVGREFIEAANATATYGDTVDKTSQRLGISRQAFQEWDYVLKLSGTDMQSVSVGFKTLTNKIDEAASGSESALAMFNSLGISMEQLQTMSKEDIFAATISGFQSMEDNAQRAALANDLFGRSGQALAPVFNMTSEETQELIDKANEYNMVMGDDAVDASAAYVDALTTLEGSFSGLKNSLMSAFLPSLTSVAEGLSAVFAGKGGVDTIQEGIEGLVSDISSMAPVFFELASAIVNGLIEGFAPQLPSLITSIFGFLNQGLLTLVSMTPQLLPVISSLLSSAMQTVFTCLPVIIQSLITLINDIVVWLSSGNNIQTLVNSIVQLVDGLASQLSVVLPVLIPALVEIISQLALALTSPENLNILIGAVLTLASGLFQTLVELVPVLIQFAIDTLKNLGELLGNFFVAAVPIVVNGITKIVEKVKSWGNSIKTFITTLITNIKTTLTNWINNVKNAFINGFNNIKNGVSNIITAVKNLVERIITKIKELPEKVVSIGKNLVKGLWNGITDKVDWVVERIKSMGSRITNAIKDVFGIASPSKVFAEIGNFLALGLGEGFEDGMSEVQSDMVSDMDGLTGNMTATINAVANPNASTLSTTNTYNGGNISINVYGAQGQNVNDLANAVAYKLEEMTRRRGVIYG